ncbi:MAG: Coq4 family protein [Myxococcota bacterium]
MTTTGVDAPLFDFEAAERHASHVAQHGTVGDRLKLALRAGYRLLSDPNDTHQVFLLGLVVNRPAVPTFLTRFVSDERGWRLMQENRTIDRANVDYDALRRLPADTLGGAYARFLDQNGLSPDMFQPPPGLPYPLTYLAKRMRQTHDLWHVVTGYSTDVHGEIALLSFYHGQTGMPLTRLIAIFGCLKFGRHRPSIFAEAWRGYRRGQRAAFLPPTPWEELWERPLRDVREMLGLDFAPAQLAA